jgi:hypothetical protein
MLAGSDLRGCRTVGKVDADVVDGIDVTIARNWAVVAEYANCKRSPGRTTSPGLPVRIAVS